MRQLDWIASVITVAILHQVNGWIITTGIQTTYPSRLGRRTNDKYARRYDSRTSTRATTGVTCFLAGNEKNNEQISLEGNDDYDYDYDLWMDDVDIDELWAFDGPDVDVSLSDDDLSLLHDSPIPFLSSLVQNSTTSTGTSKSTINATTNTVTTTTTTAEQSISDEENNHRVMLDTSQPTTILSTQDLKQIISTDLSYFYLRDEIGLSEDAMWKITNGAGSVLGLKASTVRQKIEVIRNNTGMTNEELCHVISKQPTLLQLSAKRNLSPTILFLVRKLDLGSNELKTLMMGCPSILAYSISGLRGKLSFFMDVAGFSVDECRSIFLAEPKLFMPSVQNGLMPRFRFLEREVRIPAHDLRTIIKKNPNILTMSVNENLEPKIIFFFIMTLHMSTDDVKKLLLSYPQILNYNLENHIRPIARYIISLDVSAYELARMILKFPRLVTYSLEKIKYNIGYLRFELGIDATGIRRILYQTPQVLSLTKENLDSKIDFLFQTIVPGAIRGKTSSSSSATRQVLNDFLVSMPTLLNLSIEKNLKPKVEYLQGQLGRVELSNALKRQPTLLGYSLENRIKPRLEMILDANVDGGSISIGISMKQEQFESWLVGRAKKKVQEMCTATETTTTSSTTTSTGIVAATTSSKLKQLAPAKTTNNNKSSAKTKRDSALVVKQKMTNSNDNVDKEKRNDNNDDQEKDNDDGRLVKDGGRIVHWVRKK